MTAVRSSSDLDSETAISLSFTSLDVSGSARAEETRVIRGRAETRDIMMVTRLL